MISLHDLNGCLYWTREECNRLTGIIKSRVVDSPVIRDTEDWRLSEPRNRTIGSGIAL